MRANLRDFALTRPHFRPVREVELVHHSLRGSDVSAAERSRALDTERKTWRCENQVVGLRLQRVMHKSCCLGWLYRKWIAVVDRRYSVERPPYCSTAARTSIRQHL